MYKIDTKNNYYIYNLLQVKNLEINTNAKLQSLKKGLSLFAIICFFFVFFFQSQVTRQVACKCYTIPNYSSFTHSPPPHKMLWALALLFLNFSIILYHSLPPKKEQTFKRKWSKKLICISLFLTNLRYPFENVSCFA